MDKLDAIILSTTFRESINDLLKFTKKVLEECNKVKNKYKIILIIVFEKEEKNKAQKLQQLISNLKISKFLKIIINNDNKGFPSCLNYGIKNSNSDYIFRLDTDDELVKNRLEEQLSLMISDELDLSFGDMIDQKNSSLKYPKTLLEILFTLSLGANPIAHPTVCFKRKSFDSNLFKYDEKLMRAEDLDLWIKCLLNPTLKYKHIGKTLIRYSTDRSYLKGKENSIAQIKIRFKYLKRIFIIQFSLFMGLIFNIIKLLLGSNLLIKLRRKF